MSFIENLNNLFSNKPGDVRDVLGIHDIRDDFLISGENVVALFKIYGFEWEMESEETREIMMLSFREFLIKLNAPLQIIVSKRNIDVSKYLERQDKRIESIPFLSPEKKIKLRDNMRHLLMDKMIGENELMEKEFIMCFLLSKSSDSIKHKDNVNIDNRIIRKSKSLSNEAVWKGFLPKLNERAEHISKELVENNLFGHRMREEEIINYLRRNLRDNFQNEKVSTHVNSYKAVL